MLRLLNALAACLVLCASPVFAATVTATSNDALYAATKTAKAGDELLVGFTGAINLQNLKTPGITIKPDPAATVAISQVIADGSANITFTGFEVPCDIAAAAWRSCLYAAGASGIVFDHMHVHSKDGSYTGGGFGFRDTTDSAVTNSTFDHLGTGGSTLTSQRITLSGNSFSDINTDGIDVASSCYVTVSGNSFATFHPDVGAHPDAIQLWTVQAFPACPTSEGNVIKDNVIRRETGSVMQGIFSEAQKGLVITGNAMSGTMFNGISVSGSVGADIGGNFVQGWTDDCAGQPCFTRIIVRGASSDVKVHGNAAQAVGQYLDGGQPNPGYVESNNTVIAPAAPRDYTAMNAWLAAKGASVPPPVTTPPPVVTPPTPDPRDATIATLTAANATLQASLTKAANDNAAQVTTLTAQLASATAAASASAAQVKTLQTQVTTLTASAGKAATLQAQLTVANASVSALTKKVNAAKQALQ